MRTLTTAALLTLLLVPGTAHALPGDPPITAISPAEGATVEADPEAITVEFGCPAYTKTAADEIFSAQPGSTSDYTAAFGRDPAVGPDGRLATTLATGLTAEKGGAPGVCQADLGVRAFPAPQNTPGTYYWQAWRACDSCPGGYEVGPVTRFVIRTTRRPTLKAPAKAYAGYAFVVAAAAPGTTGERRLERRSGSRWVLVQRFVGDGEPIITLPRGRQRLRVRVTAGDQVLTSATRTVTVARAGRFSTSRRDDGRYRDRARPSVRLRVTGGGRTITGFTADVPTLCASSSSSTGLTPNISTVTLPRVRIAPDGRFAYRATIRGAAVRFTGRLSRRRLVGARAAIATSSCDGSIAVQARRTSS